MSNMPSEGRIIVEDIRSKNMFNKNCVKQNWYLNYQDGKTEVWDSNMAYTTEFVDVEPNMSYTMSCDASTIFNIYEYDANKNFIQHKQQNNENNSFTITTSQNTKFIRMSCGKIRIEKIQFEQNSKATEYSKHFDFGSKQTHIVTGQEFETDEKFNGKTVYKTVVDFGVMPNSTSKSVSHNIENGETIIDVSVFCNNANGSFGGLVFPHIASSGQYMEVQITTENIFISANKDLSKFNALVTIYYTKK